MKTFFYSLLCFLMLTWSAFALPYLQLDINDPDGGTTYDPDTSTTVSGDSAFTLVALIDQDNSKHDTVVPKTYYIVAALSPAVDEVPGGIPLGSFEFSGVDFEVEVITGNDPDLLSPYDVTGDMVYGTPPEDPDAPKDINHEAYPTYFMEFSFTPDWDNRVNSYDVQYSDTPFADRVLEGDSSDQLTFAEFSIDVGDLADGYEIHFDMYTEYTVNQKGDRQLLFAPFSHDARSGGDGDGDDDYVIPEPGTLILFGFGLIGLAGVGRRKNEIV